MRIVMRDGCRMPHLRFCYRKLKWREMSLLLPGRHVLCLLPLVGRVGRARASSWYAL